MFCPLPLNMCKLEKVREIHFGILVVKGVLSSLVCTVALPLRTRRNYSQSCGTRDAEGYETSSVPIQALSSHITKVTGFSTKSSSSSVAEQQ